MMRLPATRAEILDVLNVLTARSMPELRQMCAALIEVYLEDVRTYHATVPHTDRTPIANGLRVIADRVQTGYRPSPAVLRMIAGNVATIERAARARGRALDEIVMNEEEDACLD